ncbi:lipopolysaccharide 1,2-glucosyltransferase [Candidatus Symbiopectobacterium sp. NZEC127]|uniref:glycosyltransferase family 8 protein n=1 Tax=Candidatus Symbiopectobacterium sp. NZEC127 TaxID=2820472 RepID=UPI002227C50E|nr:glycosyltransferase [Candidatus Symbiopectobacterium sp. NZEC127]MCW2488129.1 lipopolysaccharide 1,2-glucosyltransferase [Candidatus Symbiopectobacterium sp. NZEC127]
MYFDNSIVKNKLAFLGAKEGNTEKALHIAYGIDKNFLFGAAVSATSAIINNKIPITLHFFTDTIDDDDSHRFKKMAAKFNTNIYIYHIDNTPLKNLPTKNWPYSAYYRLIAFDYLASSIDRLLYLDADIVCKGPLDQLANLSFDDNVCAVVPDIKEMHKKAVDRLHCPELDGHYFNSGMMLMDLSKWHQQSFTAKVIAFILDNVELKYPDQDALNILLLKKTHILPRKYNCIFSIKSELSDRSHQKYNNVINDDAALIHYVGTTKPWNEWGQYPSTIFFQKAYLASEWHDVPLLKPRTPLQWKKKSKHEFRKYHLFSGILARLKYITTK